jgi:CDP-diacylglycerol--glycerol-3-phosphate 3-phosphatidyltransferase
MLPLTSSIGRGAKFLLDKIVQVLAAWRIHPNVFTAFGLVIASAAAFAFGYGRFFLGGWIVLFNGLFDILDGQVARRTHTVSVFGGFFDSVMDRYADLAVFFGLLVYYARLGRLHYVVLVAFAMTGAIMVSYSRARAECLIPTCKVGFMERPERLVLIIIGGLFNRMAEALWVLAVISNITVIHRIYYTWQQTKPSGKPGLPVSSGK